MSYQEQLLSTKETFPFDDWKLCELDQYTDENCDKAKTILSTLVSELIALGENASEAEKIQKFKVAVEELNVLDEETNIIETGEREELCDLFNVIAVKAGVDPSKYGSGEGPASEWRDW